MTVDQLLAHVGRLAPFSLAEEWDNVGLLVGRRSAEISGVVVSLDLRDHVLTAAVASGANLVLTHHPVIFPSIMSLTDQTAVGELILRAASQNIAVVAAHTNLDSAAGGLNDLMAQRLGVASSGPLVPLPDDPAVGLGRVGTWTQGGTLGELVTSCASAFDCSVRYVGDPETHIESVGLCTGSGGSFIAAAREAGADVYITGDLRYHDADTAEGMALIDIPHGVVETQMLRDWTPTLRDALPAIDVRFAAQTTDPWRVTHSA